MRIGIFGGTFDPPHIGHLILAAEAKAQAQLDKVLWVLTPFPPHKRGVKITSTNNRIKMVELSIQGNSGFELSYIDIDRDPPHYAIDTVMILKGNEPKDKYFYIMGFDSLIDLPKWHNPQGFISICDGLIIMNRLSDDNHLLKVEKLLPQIEQKSIYLNTPIIDISSTDIRSRIENGSQFRYFVTENVYEYILQERLYQVMKGVK